MVFVQKVCVKLAQVSKIGFKVFRQSFGKQSFSFGRVLFSGLCPFWQSQAFKIGFKVLAKVLVSLVRAFLPGSFFLAK